MITNNLRFPGQYYDAETGLHYNYFRTYDPTTGRYITSDPMGVIRNPIALVMPGASHLVGPLNHLYVYVDNNPLNSIDPMGLARVKVYGIRWGVQMFWFSRLLEPDPGPASNFHEKKRLTWTAEASSSCVLTGTETEVKNGPTRWFATHLQWWQATHTTWNYGSSSGCECRLTDYRVTSKETYFPHPGDENL